LSGGENRGLNLSRENLPKEKPLRELRELVKNLPRSGTKQTGFGRILKEIRKHQPALPRKQMGLIFDSSV